MCQYDVDFAKRRNVAIEIFKQANYDPYAIFISLQALHLDTIEDVRNSIDYLKEKEEIFLAKKPKIFKINKK